VNVAGYSLEMANRRHEHEWCVWETVKLPEGKMLLPGVIIHATNVIEHPEPVAQRLVRLARLVGSERVISSTDCGFAQGPFGRRGASLDHVGRLACAFRGSSDHEPDAWHARVLTPLCSDPFGRRRAFQIV
jgi:methionine synthase II (cobalamin-independent)